MGNKMRDILEILNNNIFNFEIIIIFHILVLLYILFRFVEKSVFVELKQFREVVHVCAANESETTKENYIKDKILTFVRKYGKVIIEISLITFSFVLTCNMYNTERDMRDYYCATQITNATKNNDKATVQKLLLNGCEKSKISIFFDEKIFLQDSPIPVIEKIWLDETKPSEDVIEDLNKRKYTIEIHKRLISQ